MFSAPDKILRGKKTVPGFNLFIVKAERKTTVRKVIQSVKFREDRSSVEFRGGRVYFHQRKSRKTS